MMSALKKASHTKSLSLSQDGFIFPRAPRPKKSQVPQKLEDTQKVFRYIDDNVIGKGVLFLGPYGRRKVVYADYSSSGRSLQFLEDYINKEVLPAFGDVECTSAVTGLQSLLYNNESRDLIKSAVNASAEQDEIIFCNNPSDRLAHLFTNQMTNAPKDPIENDTSSTSSHTCDNVQKSNVVLFVSHLEPVNNLRSWVDAGVQIERIRKNRDGFLDLVDLEKRLNKYAETNSKLIGLFSGMSRQTGIMSDDVATTILLHQYNAISLWDCSALASSAQLNVNPTLPGATKDALFFNCNKMIGGLQSPSVLIIKRSLIENFSSIQNEMVDTVSIVRCGLVMQLKEALGNHIMTRHEKICKQMLSHIRTIPEITLLGPTSTTAKRIPTMCFLVKHPRGAFLHHRFVVAVLNDVFGIQSSAENLLDRSLGMSNQLIVDYEKLLDDDSMNVENLRSGFIRITFPYFMSDAEVGYILEALKMVATEAWKLLPQYEVDEKSGEWRHHSNSLAKERKWLQSIRYTDGKMMFNDRRISSPGGFPQNFADCLQTARNLFNRARKMAQKSTVDENLYLKLSRDETEKLRWYMLPGEAHELLLGHSQNVKHTVPFDPNKSSEPFSLINMLHQRTNSLSALDVRRYQKSHSLPGTPQPTKISISPPKCGSPIAARHPLEYSSPPSPIVRFSLGGEVTCATSFGQSPQITNLIAGDSIRSRNRCHSWGSALVPTPQVLFGAKQTIRSCSVSSQTDLFSFAVDGGPHMRLGSSCSDTEDIHAYVKEVTKEITAELKSEIREVINQVEDVLENSEAVDLQTVMANISSAEDMKSDSVSAGDIVEFLKEFSKDLTSEVKSEIREASNAVDEFISPDCTNSRQQENDKLNTKLLAKQRFSDTSHDVSLLPKLHDEKHRSESLPSPEHCLRPYHYTGAISKLKTIDPKDASSQDSGINLSFHEDERKKYRNSLERNKFTFDENDDQSPISVSRQQSNDFHNDSSSATSSPKILKRQAHLIKRSSSELDPEEQTTTWHNLPKEVWKAAAETIDEFDMLRDGDKVLVGISGSSSSICLIHLLRQFIRARGLHVDLGAVTVGDGVGVDPRALMLYLRDLGVDFIFEASDNTPLKSKLSIIARRRGFNVLALGRTLDKLADDVLKLMLYKGKLYNCPPSAKNCEGDLKVVRPFIFLRERTFEDFSNQKNLPSRPSKIFSRMPDGIKSILKVQEVINPNVYDNIKSAILPLLYQNCNFSLPNK